MPLTEPTVVRYYSHPHPVNPWLQIASCEGTVWVTGSHYAQGELGVLIPEGWIVPQEIIADMELTGLLAGPEKNRVKASKFKGVRSEGVFYGRFVDGEMSPHWNPEWREGDSESVIREWHLIEWINEERIPLDNSE